MARRRRAPRGGTERVVTDVVARLSRTHNGRRLLLVLAVVALLAWAGSRVWDNYFRVRHPVGPTVRLATWNIRQFSERPNIDLATIADIIRNSSFDVVALQEVKGSGEQVDALLNALGSPWRATSISPVTGNYERFVFLYHGDHVQEVRDEGGPRFVSSPDLGVFARAPYQATFRAGNFDFTLVSVHLSWDDTRRRRAESEALARVGQDLAARSREKDVILLGDFNDEDRRYSPALTGAGWQSLHAEPTNLGSSQVYDLLLIDPRHTGEWSGVGGCVKFDEIIPRYRDDALARAHVSDHRPAYADFVTNLPDDD